MLFVTSLASAVKRVRHPPDSIKDVVVFKNEELHLFQQKSKIIKSANLNLLKMLMLVVIELGCKSVERKLHL